MPSSASFTSWDDTDISSHFHDFITLEADSDAPSHLQPPCITTTEVDDGDASLIWLGDKALEATIASAIIQTSRGTRDVHRLNSLLHSIKAIVLDKRTSLVLSSLGSRSAQQTGCHGAASPSEQVLRVIGLVYRENDNRRLQSLFDIIKRSIRVSYGVEQGQGVPGRHHEQQCSSPPKQTPTTERVGHFVTHEGISLPTQAYTMAFYEHAQAEKEEIRFSFRRADYGTLPSFRAEYLYCGKEYSGNGQSRQEAKHLASKDACEDLNIYIHA